MREIVQFVLKVLRWFHIDVYVMMKNHAERRMWRRALPENGVLGEKGLCVAVPLRSFSSVGQVGRDFVRRLMKTSIPFSLFNIDYGYSSAGQLPESEVSDLLARVQPKIRERNVFACINGAVHGDRQHVFSSQLWWEFTSGLVEEHADAFDGVRHVVAMSDFRKFIEAMTGESIHI